MALFHDAWTSSLDVNTFADIAVNLFLDFKHRGVINVAAGEVYSKEQLIRRLADMLSISHIHCTSESIKRRFSNRPNCLGLDVSKAERLLGKKMPELNEVCAALISQLNLK
jgi:dTDP-4-dehydrorhamnose reductase